jgi:hypothetical protein
MSLSLPGNSHLLSPSSPGRNPFRSIRIACLVLAGCLASGTACLFAREELTEGPLPPAADHQIDFEREIRPILESACLRCHSGERPRSRYRLTTREAAIAGGVEGRAIIPGDSGASPLIHYVAGLVEGMEMPPEGEPLTPAQIGLLRAWIDQGVAWSEEEPAERFEFSMTPRMTWIGVRGNQGQFREQNWLPDGWSGGVERFGLEKRIDPETKVRADGWALWGREDFKVALTLERREVGFASAGVHHWRGWFDDAGGYFPLFEPSLFRLERELHLDRTRIWTEAGFNLPNWPALIFGYEYRRVEGARSSLQWGDVLGGDGELRKIYPGFKRVDEEIHTIKFDLAYEIGGVRLDNRFRAEWHELAHEQRQALLYDLSRGALEKESLARNEHRHFQASDSFQAEKEVRDWLLVSGGYFFSLLDGDAAFSQSTILAPAAAIPIFPDDKFWFSRRILLEQMTHLFNLNSRLGPWQGFSIHAGVQNDWMRQKGSGDAFLEEGEPGLFPAEPTRFASDLDKMAVEERFGIQFTKIPGTVLFAEARWRQEKLDHFEEGIGGLDFLRETEATTWFQEYRGGLTLTPWTWLAFKTEYRRRLKEIDYDHARDEFFGRPNQGYSAFIRWRRTDLDEYNSRLILRWSPAVRSTLSYRLVSTDYFTETEPYIIPELVIPGLPPFPTEEISPGGRKLLSGNYDAHIVSFNTSWAPLSHWRFDGTLSLQDSRTRTVHPDLAAVADYQGRIYSLLTEARYQWNARTQLHAGYDLSYADYKQRHFSEGLPLGIRYTRHGVRSGFSRQFRENITSRLHYLYFAYDEPTRGGALDYQAHGVMASLTIKFR